MAAYIFVYFTEEIHNGEQVYFSASKDGLHWQDLNGGSPVFTAPSQSCLRLNMHAPQ